MLCGFTDLALASPDEGSDPPNRNPRSLDVRLASGGRDPPGLSRDDGRDRGHRRRL